VLSLGSSTNAVQAQLVAVSSNANKFDAATSNDAGLRVFTPSWAGRLHLGVVTTGGAPTAICVNSNNMVGILNTTPQYALDVAGDLNLTGTLRSNGVPFVPGGSSFSNVGGLARVFLPAGSNLGVGTSAATQPLTISGNAYVQNGVLGVGAAPDSNYSLTLSNSTGTQQEVGLQLYSPSTGQSRSDFFLAGGTGQGYTPAVQGDLVLRHASNLKMMIGPYQVSQPTLTLTSSNYVGVSNTAPAYPLDVGGTGRFGSNLFAGCAAVGITAFGAAGAAFCHSNMVASAASWALLQDGSGNTYLNANSNQSISFRLNNATTLMTVNSNGVGVGTNINPAYPLDIGGAIAVAGRPVVTSGLQLQGLSNAIVGNEALGAPPDTMLQINGTRGGGWSRTNIRLNHPVYNGMDVGIGSNMGYGTVGGAAVLIAVSNVPLILGNNNVEQMRIASNGYVGINNSNPLCKLHVSGTASVDALLRVDVPAGNQCGFVAAVGNSNWNILAKPSPNLLSFEYNGSGVANLSPAGNMTLLTGSPIIPTYYQMTFQISSTWTAASGNYYYFNVNGAIDPAGSGITLASFSNGRQFYPPVAGIWSARVTTLMYANNSNNVVMFISKNSGGSGDLNLGAGNTLALQDSYLSNVNPQMTLNATTYLGTGDSLLAGVFSYPSAPGAVAAGARTMWTMSLVQRTA
jgi:hypothetical protein